MHRPARARGVSRHRKSAPTRHRHRDEVDEQLAERLVRLLTSRLLPARGKPGQAAAAPPATRGSAPGG
jgi:hypothetical protein